MTIKDLFKENPKIETDLLLSHVLGKPKEFLYSHPNTYLTTKQLSKLAILIKRRTKGEPVAYLVGYKYFYSHKFLVSTDVLIPRPETELLVKHVEELLKKKPFDISSSVNVLDVGTGSGNIIISLAKQFKQKSKLKFYGLDISKSALNIAKLNSVRHKVKVKFIYSDLLKSINQPFDIIIANLPYGWKEWKNNTSAETIGLKFEPKQALLTGKKGLQKIEKLLNQIAKRTQKPKFILIEFDPRQKAELQNLIKEVLPKAKTKFYRDLNHLWRYCEIYLF